MIAVVVGTDEDPQNMAQQIEQLRAVNVRVEVNNEDAVRYAGHIARNLDLRAGVVPIDLRDQPSACGCEC